MAPSNGDLEDAPESVAGGRPLPGASQRRSLKDQGVAMGRLGLLARWLRRSVGLGDKGGHGSGE